MSLKFLNEGFELRQFNVLQESVVNQITSILNTLNEATMSDEDKRDNELLRQILSKASEASYDKRRALKWTPQELDIADKYNLTLPQRTTKWDGSKEITSLKDNDVDYERGFGRNRQVRNLEFDDAMAYADEQRQKESERGQQGVADATSKINKLLRKESFIHALEEKLNSLNEAEMSAEDKHDSEILKQIYRKTQARSNAALTPEEKEVLQKYDLERNPDTKNVRLSTRNIPNSSAYIFRKDDEIGRVDPKTGGFYKPSDRINYADRARKRPERGEHANRFEYDHFDPAPDYERDHGIDNDEYWNGTKYQRMERIADNQEMTQNVRKMKDVLQQRNSGQKFLDNSRAQQDAKIKDMKAAYEKRLAALQQHYDDETRYSKSIIDRANNEIDALLKRGEP